MASEIIYKKGDTIETLSARYRKCREQYEKSKTKLNNKNGGCV